MSLQVFRSFCVISDPVCFPWRHRHRVPSQQAACSTPLSWPPAWYSGRLPPCLTWQMLCQAQSSWLKDGSSTAQGGVQESVEQIWVLQFDTVCMCVHRQGDENPVVIIGWSTDCGLLAASRTSSFFNSYYFCYLRLEKITLKASTRQIHGLV